MLVIIIRTTSGVSSFFQPIVGILSQVTSSKLCEALSASQVLKLNFNRKNPEILIPYPHSLVDRRIARLRCCFDIVDVQPACDEDILLFHGGRQDNIRSRSAHGCGSPCEEIAALK